MIAHQAAQWKLSDASDNDFVVKFRNAMRSGTSPAPVPLPRARPGVEGTGAVDRALPVVASAGYAVLAAVVLHRLGSAERIPDYLAFSLVLAVVWLMGSGARRRRTEAERRRPTAEVAAAAERARIARPPAVGTVVEPLWRPIRSSPSTTHDA
ncbi:hypothetical protein [Peterkaempfera sp. SMS 1(5)a]|uniref:hypothetical protein n=1 Tax=Peterkaempfera podocarpi TaxID=3232308 RepID=UPI00366AC162